MKVEFEHTDFMPVIKSAYWFARHDGNLVGVINKRGDSKRYTVELKGGDLHFADTLDAAKMMCINFARAQG